MAKMRIFLRVRPELVVGDPNYNVPHSATPPYLWSGAKKVVWLRMNPANMMRASVEMYRERGLLKRGYILIGGKVWILLYEYLYSMLPPLIFKVKPDQPFGTCRYRTAHLLCYVMQHQEGWKNA